MGGGAKKKNANKAALLAQKRKKAEKKGERAAAKQAKKRGERSDTLEEVLEQCVVLFPARIQLLTVIRVVVQVKQSPGLSARNI